MNKQLDKHAIIASFNQAATSYDQAAFLQREVATRILERLQWINAAPKTILDLGVGTGYCTPFLAQMYPDANIICVDLAKEMLRFAKNKNSPSIQQSLGTKIKQLFSANNKANPRINYLCADAEQLPLKNNTVDMIFSNLTFQWCENYPLLFTELARVLSPQGFVLFSTFGVDTLKELKQSWSQVSSAKHVNEFVDMHDLGDAMSVGGLCDAVMDVEKIVMEYGKVQTLTRDLKNIGAQNHLADRKKGLLGKKTFYAMIQAYEQFKLANDKYPATYEIVYGHAWKKDINKQQQKNTVQINFADIKKQLRA